MKNMLKLNERDNVFTAFAKGGVKGILISSVVAATSMGVGLIVRAKSEKSVEEVLEVVEEVIEE